MKPTNLFIFSLSIVLFACSGSENLSNNIQQTYPIVPVPYNQVHLQDNFWMPKIEINRTATIPASFKRCEDLGRYENFLIAGGKMKEEVRGKMPFDDTDVYKTIEGASYTLATIPDEKMDAYLDSVIGIIAIGQEDDGYLTTYKSIDPTKSPAEWCPPGKRWEHLDCSHELYNSGHLFEAAAAHYLVTGKTNFLDIALKNADLLVKVFGNDTTNMVPGHQIVETGLIKLYLITQKTDYLNLAKKFLDLRGDSTKREIWTDYMQDHKPVTEQTEAVGHAVRAAYMYAGMTDIAALTGDSTYNKAIKTIWDNVVSKKIYITGGIGALHDGEAFGDNYELPNLTAYNETCAAIANVYWNYRMFQLYGDAKYIDVLERTLYNGLISGVSLDGTSFFYPNPLSCNMEYEFNNGGSLTREKWFDCSCCPTNLCRFMPSVPGYIYAQHEQDVYINLFVQSETSLNINNNTVALKQTTNYPWNGDVELFVTPKQSQNFNIKIRIPGWSQGQPIPSDLYKYVNDDFSPLEILVNGKAVAYTTEKGYAVINRDWKADDKVSFILPMEVKKVKANKMVAADKGKIAIERGPIVYCLEEKDNSDIDKTSIKADAVFKSEFKNDLLGGVEIVSSNDFIAIPYYVWNNRGANKMKVWIDEK